MSSRTIIGTIDETTSQITAAARDRGWLVEIYSRSDNGVVLYLAGANERWSALIRVETDGSGRVSMAKKRTRGATTAVLAMLTVLGTVFSLLLIVVAIYASTMAGGSVDKGRLGFVVAILVIPPLARMIWIWRPTQVRRDREVDLLMDQLVAAPNDRC